MFRMEVQERLLVIDSTFRDRALFPSASDFRVYFPVPLTDVYKVELVDACLPNVSYNVTELNQVISWQEQVSGSTTSLSVKVPTGHYTEYTLADEIQRLMNSASQAFKEGNWPAYATLNPYAVTYDRVHNSFRFSLKYMILDRFRLLFPGNDLHELLGFDPGSTGWNVDGSITSVRPTIIDDASYTFLSSSELDDPLTLCLGDRYGSGPDALRAFAWFPNSTTKGGVIHHLWPSIEDVHSRETVFRPPRASISSMGFKLLDAKGNALETQGVEMDFVLRVFSLVRVEKQSDDLVYDSIL